MSAINTKFWWDATIGVTNYSVTITPTLGGSPVFIGSTTNNYINTTTLPLNNGTSYNITIIAYCGSGTTSTVTSGIFINSDGTYTNPLNTFKLTTFNNMAPGWGTITKFSTDTGTSIITSLGPSSIGILKNSGILSTSGGPDPYIYPSYYTTNFIFTIHNTSSSMHISNYYLVRNGITEAYSNRIVIPAGATVDVPINILKPPHNTDTFTFDFI